MYTYRSKMNDSSDTRDRKVQLGLFYYDIVFTISVKEYSVI
jgi:hypothetical protein